MTKPVSVNPRLFLEIATERTNSGFSKILSGGYLFVFVEYLYKRSPKMGPKISKNIKNYISVLAIVNCRNWLAASPSLKSVPGIKNGTI